MSFRYALRSLSRAPLYALATIVSLGVAIALNTAMFSVVEAALFRPLPYHQSERLFGIQDPRRSTESEFLSSAEYRHFREQARSFDAVAAYRSGFAGRRALRLETGSATRQGFAVSTNLFRVLGVTPVLGRAFVPDDEHASDRPVVLAHSVWKRDFGGDAGVLGAPLRVDGVTHRVVGVMPEGFWFPFEDAQFWVPLAAGGEDDYSLSLVGRLRDDTGSDAAASETRVLVERLSALRTGAELPRVSHFVALEVARRPSDAAFFYVLLGVTLCILAVSCANLSGLALMRAVDKTRETAIRAAVGAGRWHQVKPLLAEALVLVAAAAAVGVFLSWAGLRLLEAALPVALQNILTGVNVRTLVFTLGLGVLTLGLCTLAPVVQTWRVHTSLVLKEHGAAASGGTASRRLRSGLVVGQIALSLVLLTSTGLMVRGLARVGAWDPGFDADGLWSITLRPGAGADADVSPQALERMRRHLLTKPGVEEVAFSSPYPGPGLIAGEGGIAAQCECILVSPEYLRTMGIAVRRGRAFNEADLHAGGAVVVDEKLAATLWSGGDPLNATVRLGAGSSAGAPLPIVGVASHADFSRPSLDRASEQLPALVYVVAPHVPRAAVTVGVRTSLPSAQAGPLIRSALLEIDPDLPIYELQPASAALGAYLGSLRWYVGLLATFAMLALVLSLVGLYSVVSYGIMQRGRELAIRIALGAEPRDVVPMVLSGAFRLVLAGTVVGLLGASLAGKVVSTMVAGVRPLDVPILAGVVTLLFLASMLGCLPPALRVARTDAMDTLRDQ